MRTLSEIVKDSYAYMKQGKLSWTGAENLVREAYKLGLAHGKGEINPDSYAKVVAAKGK